MVWRLLENEGRLTKEHKKLLEMVDLLVILMVSQVSKLIGLFPLNMHGSLYIYYTSIKLYLKK